MQPQKPPFHKPGRVFRTLLAGFLLITGILSQPVHTQAQADAVHARPADSTEVETADRLESIYSRLEGFGGVRVEVIENVVRLTGTVPTSVASEQAETLAKSQDGVDFVINDLTTDVQVRSRLAPAVDRFETYIDSAIAYLPILALALIVLVFFSFLARMAGKLDKPLERTKMPPMTRMLVLRLVSVVIFLVGLVLALDILDVTALVGTILGAAGLAGVALGFAFKDIVENYLAGVLLSIRRPFTLGDHVKVDDVEGKALRLTSRELLLMTLDGNHVRLPNSVVFKATIYNYTRNPRRRFDFAVGVGVDEDLVQVSSVGLATLSAIPGVLDSPGPNMIVVELGDSSVVVRFFAWVDQTEADFGKARSAGIRLVKDALDEAGISMPEPTYNVKLQGTPAAEPPEDVKPVDSIRETSGGTVQSVVEQAQEADVGVDTSLEKQMREDLDQTDEPNLLNQSR